MSLLLRTALRHHTNGLSCLLRTHQIRPICVSSIKFNETKQNKNDSASAVTRSSAGNNADVSTNVRPIGERIKENTKTASYMGVILVGIAVTAALLGTIARELMMSGSPNNVYSAALAVCIDDPRVQDALGPPIKAYGEETRRRRRQHVAHKIYVRNSEPYIQMHFYIQGIRNKATVQLECRLVCLHPLNWP